MEQPSKVSLDVEERIQSLAGDIYVQIEDKVTAFVSAYAKPEEITNEIIENHIIYQSLKESYNQLTIDLENVNSSHLAATEAYEKTLSELKIQISSRDDTIKNNEQLNTAKLTDTEQVLKEKLVELSKITASYDQLTIENETQSQALTKVTEQLEQSTQTIKTLELSEHTLAKNDKAKSATLEVQNHQISDLTLQLNNITSELDYLKAEHGQQAESSSEQYQKEINILKQKVINSEASLSTEITKKKALEDNVKILTQSITHTDKVLSNEKVATDKLNKEMELLKQKNTVVETSLQDEQQAVEHYKTDIKEFKSKVIELEKVIATEVDSGKSLQSKVIELTQTIDELGTSLVKEKEDLEQVKAKSILTQKEIITLNEQLNVSKNAQQEAERLLSADKQIQGQQKSKHLLEIDSLKQSIDKHCSELETQISSNERNKVKVDKLYQTIADLEKDKELSIQKDKEKEDLHQASLVELNKTLTQEKSTIKEYIEQLDSQKTVVEKQAETHKDLLGKFKSADVESSKKIVDLGNKITSLEKNIMALTSENRDLTKNAEESNRIIDGYQQEITHLKENYESANNNAQQVKQRAEANKEKQESEFTKARDTIKYLRDENLDLNTKLDKQVTELEDKLREYRLRFEYAQKQLNS